MQRFATESQVSDLFVIYGLGFAAVFSCIALLYRRALALRDELGLSDLEVHDGRTIFWHYMILVLMALISVLLQADHGPHHVPGDLGVLSHPAQGVDEPVPAIVRPNA